MSVENKRRSPGRTGSMALKKKRSLSVKARVSRIGIGIQKHAPKKVRTSPCSPRPKSHVGNKQTANCSALASPPGDNKSYVDGSYQHRKKVTLKGKDYRADHLTSNTYDPLEYDKGIIPARNKETLHLSDLELRVPPTPTKIDLQGSPSRMTFDGSSVWTVHNLANKLQSPKKKLKKLIRSDLSKTRRTGSKIIEENKGSKLLGCSPIDPQCLHRQKNKGKSTLTKLDSADVQPKPNEDPDDARHLETETEADHTDTAGVSLDLKNDSLLPKRFGRLIPPLKPKMTSPENMKKPHANENTTKTEAFLNEADRRLSLKRAHSAGMDCWNTLRDQVIRCTSPTAQAAMKPKSLKRKNETMDQAYKKPTEYSELRAVEMEHVRFAQEAEAKRANIGDEPLVCSSETKQPTKRGSFQAPLHNLLQKHALRSRKRNLESNIEDSEVRAPQDHLMKQSSKLLYPTERSTNDRVKRLLRNAPRTLMKKLSFDSKITDPSLDGTVTTLGRPADPTVPSMEDRRNVDRPAKEKTSAKYKSQATSVSEIAPLQQKRTRVKLPAGEHKSAKGAKSDTVSSASSQLSFDSSLDFLDDYTAEFTVNGPKRRVDSIVDQLRQNALKLIELEQAYRFARLKRCCKDDTALKRPVSEDKRTEQIGVTATAASRGKKRKKRQKVEGKPDHVKDVVLTNEFSVNPAPARFIVEDNQAEVVDIIDQQFQQSTQHTYPVKEFETKEEPIWDPTEKMVGEEIQHKQSALGTPTRKNAEKSDGVNDTANRENELQLDHFQKTGEHEGLTPVEVQPKSTKQQDGKEAQASLLAAYGIALLEEPVSDIQLSELTATGGTFDTQHLTEVNRKLGNHDGVAARTDGTQKMARTADSLSWHPVKQITEHSDSAVMEETSHIRNSQMKSSKQQVGSTVERYKKSKSLTPSTKRSIDDKSKVSPSEQVKHTPSADETLASTRNTLTTTTTASFAQKGSSYTHPERRDIPATVVPDHLLKVSKGVMSLAQNDVSMVAKSPKPIDVWKPLSESERVKICEIQPPEPSTVLTDEIIYGPWVKYDLKSSSKGLLSSAIVERPTFPYSPNAPTLPGETCTSTDDGFREMEKTEGTLNDLCPLFHSENEGKTNTQDVSLLQFTTPPVHEQLTNVPITGPTMQTVAKLHTVTSPLEELNATIRKLPRDAALDPPFIERDRRKHAARKHRRSAKRTDRVTAMAGELVSSKTHQQDTLNKDDSLTSRSVAVVDKTISQYPTHGRSIDSRTDGEILDVEVIRDLRGSLLTEPVLQEARPLRRHSAPPAQVEYIQSHRPDGESVRLNESKLTSAWANERSAGDLAESVDIPSSNRIIAMTEKPSRLLTISQLSFSKQTSEYTLDAEDSSASSAYSLKRVGATQPHSLSIRSPTILIHRRKLEPYVSKRIQVGRREKSYTSRGAQTPQPYSTRKQYSGRRKWSLFGERRCDKKHRSVRKLSHWHPLKRWSSASSPEDSRTWRRRRLSLNESSTSVDSIGHGITVQRKGWSRGKIISVNWDTSQEHLGGQVSQQSTRSEGLSMTHNDSPHSGVSNKSTQPTNSSSQTQSQDSAKSDPRLPKSDDVSLTISFTGNPENSATSLSSEGLLTPSLERIVLHTFRCDRRKHDDRLCLCRRRTDSLDRDFGEVTCSCSHDSLSLCSRMSDHLCKCRESQHSSAPNLDLLAPGCQITSAFTKSDKFVQSTNVSRDEAVISETASLEDETRAATCIRGLSCSLVGGH
ncbi:unnamed protein product [Dicrocoelium dendriticum]|nr:unnamed protein product [Dicrocoelium dendriticum]